MRDHSKPKEILANFVTHALLTRLKFKRQPKLSLEKFKDNLSKNGGGLPFPPDGFTARYFCFAKDIRTKFLRIS